MSRRLPLRLSSRDRKLLGLCAGIGRSLRIDPTFVRIAVVAVPVLTFVTFFQMLVAYLLCGAVAAFAAGRRPQRSDYERMGEAKAPSIHDVRTRLDDADRRMMAIDHHLNDSRSRDLAREIEALRKEQA